MMDDITHTPKKQTDSKKPKKGLSNMQRLLSENKVSLPQADPEYVVTPASNTEHPRRLMRPNNLAASSGNSSDDTFATAPEHSQYDQEDSSDIRAESDLRSMDELPNYGTSPVRPSRISVNCDNLAKVEGPETTKTIPDGGDMGISEFATVVSSRGAGERTNHRRGELSTSNLASQFSSGPPHNSTSLMQSGEFGTLRNGASVQPLPASNGMTQWESFARGDLYGLRPRLSLSSDASTVVPDYQASSSLSRNGITGRPDPGRPVCFTNELSIQAGPVLYDRSRAQGEQRGSVDSNQTLVQSPESLDGIFPMHTARSRLSRTSSTLVPSFSYNRQNDITKCWLPVCQLYTSSALTSTSLCPRCGPLSYVRYCSVRHLHADALRHYPHECTNRPNLLPHVDMLTVDPVSGPARPFVRCSEPNNDSFERYRQALYLSYPPDIMSDYYVFSDVDQLIANEGADASLTPTLLAKYRGTGAVIATVRIHPRETAKAQFAPRFARLLSLGQSASRINPAACHVLFISIKNNLMQQGLWDDVMVTRLCLAMTLEFGWTVPSQLRWRGIG